jgi:LacI family transcriptional regulator
MRKRTNTNQTMVTIRDIAKEAGFSASTVSIVLNDAPLSRYIRTTTKRRIHDVARALGYSPNQLARSLRSQRNHTVGAMVFDITDPFCTPILRGIESTLYQASYVPILADAHNDRTRFERALEMLLERRVEGLIVIANWLFVDIEILADLEKRSIPTAVIGRKLTETISSVQVDNEAGARIAIEHLHKLGHRKIAFIRGPKVLADSAQRWRGIRSFARAAGMSIDARLAVELPNSFNPNHAFETAFRLTEELIRNGREFTALMAFDDITALGAMRALLKAGKKVPDDCAVIGFDDVAPAALSAPSLTTIRQPMETMGACAVEVVMGAINASLEKQEFTPVHRRLPPEIVVRESTAKVR